MTYFLSGVALECLSLLGGGPSTALGFLIGIRFSWRRWRPLGCQRYSTRETCLLVYFLRGGAFDSFFLLIGGPSASPSVLIDVRWSWQG